MSKTRIYGSPVTFGSSVALWTTLSKDGGFSPSCVDVVDDIQDATDTCYVSRTCNNSTNIEAYAIPDAAIPDNANVSLAEWGVRYRTVNNPGAVIAQPSIDGAAVESGWADTFGSFVSDTSKTHFLFQLGSAVKASAWGFASLPFSPAFFYTVSFSEFALRLTFTLPATIVTTGTAVDLTSTTATLRGTFDANTATVEYPASYKFEWGLTTSYGNETTVVSGQSGSGGVSVMSGIFGLAAGTTYHFRLVGFNDDTTTLGADATFTTSLFDAISLAF